MALLPGLLAAAGVGTLVYAFVKPNRPNYDDVLSGKLTLASYNARMGELMKKFNPDDKPIPPPPPAKEFPHSALEEAQSGGTKVPDGTLVLNDVQITADASHDWEPGTIALGQTIPVSWMTKDGTFGAQPCTLIWLSPDKQWAVIAWNAGQPTAAGVNLSKISDNQLVLAKVGKNSLTKRVIDWWKYGGAL